MTRLVGLDFETTGVDVASCEVVQAAFIASSTSGNGEQAETVLCRSRSPIPAGATRVHGLFDERSPFHEPDIEPTWTPIPEDAPHFSQFAGQLFDFVESEPDTILVTFNGLRFDVPVWERIARRRLRVPHIDVYRLHLHAKAAETECEHVEGRWPASIFAGSLAAAHAFWTGRMFKGAHDALVDVRATLDTLQGMLDYPYPMAGGYTIESALELTWKPLPGDVDLDGKFKWSGDDVVITIGDLRGTSIRNRAAHGFMQWMLKKDFAEDTKAICRAALRGEYPKRETS